MPDDIAIVAWANTAESPVAGAASSVATILNPPPDIPPPMSINDIVGMTIALQQYHATDDAANMTSIATPETYTVTFSEDGELTIQADCNQVTGTYVADGNNLSIDLGASTLAECGPDSHSGNFLSYLGSAEAMAVYLGDDSTTINVLIISSEGSLQFTATGE